MSIANTLLKFVNVDRQSVEAKERHIYIRLQKCVKRYPVFPRFIASVGILMELVGFRGRVQNR